MNIIKSFMVEFVIYADAGTPRSTLYTDAVWPT